MHRQRSEKPAVGKRGGGKWLSSRSSFRVDKQPGSTVEAAVAGGGGANHGGVGGGGGPNCGRISEGTSLTEPVSSDSSTTTNTKKGLDDFALPNWEMPSTTAPSATGNTTAVLPPAYQQRGGFQPPPQQQPPMYQPQSQSPQRTTHHSVSQREFSQQQHRMRPPHENDDIENMLVMCHESQGDIADDITYLTMDSEDAEGSRGGSRGSPNNRYRKQGLGSAAAGYHHHHHRGGAAPGGGMGPSGARGGGGLAPYSHRQDDDLDYRDRDQYGDGNRGDYHHPYLHGHHSQQQQQQYRHHHQGDERSRQSGSSYRGVDNRQHAPYDRHLLDDGRSQRSSYGGRDGDRYQQEQQYVAPPRHNMPYEGARGGGDPRAQQAGRRPALYDDHVRQAAELDEDEMLELAMEQSLAETTNRRGGGRSQSLVERPRESSFTSRSSVGNSRRSYSGGRFSRRNSLEGNPMAMHMPPPSEDDSNKPQPDFIWKKGPNNRYYKCPLSELDEDELEEAARGQYMSEDERLAQIEQDILEQAMEASIADARKRPGAVQVPPPSHLDHDRNNSRNHIAGGSGSSVSCNRRRSNTAPQYSNQQRPLPEDDHDYGDEEEPGKTQAEIEQEELLIRLTLERSMRDGGGDNVSVHSSHHRPTRAPRQRRDSMPAQYPDGHWGDRSPVRQEPTVSPHQSRRASIRDYADRRGNNSDEPSQMHGSFSSRRSLCGGGGGDIEGRSVSSGGAFVWKKTKGGRYYKAPIDSIEEMESLSTGRAHVPPIIDGIPSMPHLETEAQRLERMERDMLRVAMERSMMEN